MCGRRHAVVLMVFLGMLILIGSREVFTMVIIQVIQGVSGDETNIFHLTCLNETLPVRGDWHKRYEMQFQLAYFCGSFVTQIPGGVLAARFSSRHVSGVSTLISSLLTIAMILTIKFYSQPWPVFVIRCLQGLAEGPSVPALSGVIAAWAPKSEKTILLTISYSGAYISAGVASLLSGVLLCLTPWWSIMALYGCAGVLWALIWLCLVCDTPAKCTKLSFEERELFKTAGSNSRSSRAVFRNIPWRGILTSLPVSAIVIASFCRNWIFALLVTEIPVYFKDVFPSMDAAEIGMVSAFPHILMAVVVVTAGLAVNAILRRHCISTTIVRKAAETVGFGIEAGCFLGLAFVKKQEHAVALLTTAVACSGIAISGYQVNPLDLAPLYVSVLTGISRLGTIGAIICTFLAGYLDRDHSQKSWQTIFIVAASLHLAGVLYYLIFASGELQPWAEPEDVRPTQRLPDVAASEESALLSSGYETDDGESALERLLTRSMHVERADENKDDDYEPPYWFMNTI